MRAKEREREREREQEREKESEKKERESERDIVRRVYSDNTTSNMCISCVPTTLFHVCIQTVGLVTYDEYKRKKEEIEEHLASSDALAADAKHDGAPSP